MSQNIVLIEDDLQMQELIVDYLSSYNFVVMPFKDPTKALEYIRLNSSGKIDLVVLDLMLPKMDGFDVCKEIRSYSMVPIIISSARGEISDKLLTYELGADDYLAKPYEPRELVIRINAILRRSNSISRVVGEFEVNEERREIKVAGYEIDLTSIEYEILLIFLSNAQKVISREQIINASKSIGYEAKTRTVDMHVSNIRQKIGDNSKEPRYIKSVWGIGYKFVG